MVLPAADSRKLSSMVDETDTVHRRKDSSTEATLSCASSVSVGSLDATADVVEEMTLKPFFIMDWLERVDSNDLEKAQRLLQISHKQKPRSSWSWLKPSALPKKAPTMTSFRAKSISMGNLWNSRGLQRAQVGRWDEALLCWRNALEIRGQVLGEEHIDTANTCNNIGIALGKLDRVDEASTYLQRALQIRVTAFGKEDSQVAATYHNLGNIYQQGGRLEEAVNCFLEAKRLQEQLVGPYNVEVGRAYVSMGHTYYQASQHKDAREAYCDALYVFQHSGIPKSNMEVRNVMANIQELDHLLIQTDS